MNAKKIAKQIKKLREEKGLTMTELSKLTGITISSLSHYESGYRIPSDENKVLIARAFSTTIDEIFYS